MTVEVNVVGMRCGAKNGGLSCLYCFESPLVSRGYPLPMVDLPAVKAAIDAAIGDSRRACKGCGAELPSSSFSLFGGEPLLAPLDVLEDLWKFGLEKYGRNGVQTSGRPITEEHWPLFRKYKVCVSFSIDGPEELNDARRAGDIEATRQATAHSIEWMHRLLEAKMAVGLIVTLSKYNAGADRRHKLLTWFSDLGRRGLRNVTLHLMQQDRRTAAFALTPAENLEVLLAIRRHEVAHLRTMKFNLFEDVLALLRGKDAWTWNDGSPAGVGCTWAGCDPMTTPAVQGVEPDGTRSLCPRVHSTPIARGAGPDGPQVRQLVLRSTPQADGGCQGCRQIITCKGQCPGTAIDGDWRKRSRDCATWKGLLEHFEGVLLEAGETPITLRKDRDEIEGRMAEWWAAGRAVRLSNALAGERPGRSWAYYQDHDDHDDHDDLGPAVARLAGGEHVAG